MTLKNTNAKIYVNSHIVTDGEGMDFQTVTDGSFYIKNNKYYIIYEEKDLMRDFGKCTTTVKCDGESVYMKRSGNLSTSLEFTLGQAKRSTYNFDVGAIVLESLAKRVEFELGSHGGKINLEYDLDIGGQKSYNKVEITVEATQIKGDKNG